MNLLFFPLAAMFLAVPVEVARAPAPVVCYEPFVVCHEYFVDLPPLAAQVVSQAAGAP